MSLADIPGYGAFVARRQMNEAAPLAELQQVGALQALLEKQRQTQMDIASREAVQAAGGDAESAVAALLKSGNVKAAHELAPLVKLQQEQRMREESVKGLAALQSQYGPRPAAAAAPSGPQELGVGQPVAVAGEDAAPAPAAAPVSDNSPQRLNSRIEHLRGMALLPLYANNPIAQQRIQAEIDALTRQAEKVPAKRDRIQGDIVIQEEHQPDGTWKEIGRGPRFSKHGTVVKMGGEEPPAVTDDTLAMDAWRYLTDGTLPTNMGRGIQGAAQATKIRNEASRLAKEMGMPADEIRMAQLTNKAQVGAIAQLARAKAQILQFEKTANMNADLALEASGKVDRTGVPVFNKWLQAGRTAIAGDTEALKFHAATETFISEYARVMSGGYGAAQTTEGAQNRAHELLNTAATKEQFTGVIGQLKREMANRVKALNDQMAEERNNLRSGIVRTPTATPPAGGAKPAGSPSVDDLLKKYGG